MSDPVIVGMITAVASVICQVIISLSGRSAAQRERAESQKVITYRLEAIENEMKNYNGLAERTYKLEERYQVLKEDVDILKKER